MDFKSTHFGRAERQDVRCAPRLLRRVALLGLVLLLGIQARADSVFLRGGERLIGKVVAEEPAKIIFESQALGRFEILRDRIERIECAAPDQMTSPAKVSVPVTNAAALPSWATQPLWAQNDPYDWIQLRTGEWLKGRLKSLLEEKLEFDSEEMDLHTFDWDKILTVRSPRLNSVRFDTGKPLDGTLLVTSNEVRVVSTAATNVFPRAELVAITPTGNHEVDKWTGKIAVGVSFRAGNTREVDYNARTTFQRRTPTTRLALDYLGNYGRINGEETENNHRVTTQFDYFLSRRLYARVPDVEYYRDPLQNLDHRLTLGAGFGYDLVKTSRTEWNVTLSPSWQRNYFTSVPAGQSGFADAVALVLSTRFDIELTRRLDFIFEYRGQLSRAETGNNTHHTVATLEFEIHKRLKLDLSFIWDRITTPKTESNGATPTPDDFRMTTSLGIDF